MRLRVLVLLSTGAFAGPDLFDAIRNGDAAAVAQLAVAANQPRADGTTPLHHAVVTAAAPMVELLLRHKADPKAANAGGYTPLHYALSDIKKTTLLLAAGADPNATAKNGMSPLRIAASRKGAQPFVEALLAAGAKPSSDVVEAAASTGEPGVLVTLLKKGATVAPNSTSLVNAAVVNCLACAPILLQAGASVNQRGVRGQTALQNAAAYQNLEFVRLLLDQGADVDPQCARGYSALMRAAISYDRNPSVVRLLLSRGARTDLKEENGITALTLAYRFGPDDPIVEVLRQAKAPGAAEPIPVSAAPAKSPRHAVERALPLLQTTAPAVWKTRGCVSCHSNSMPDMVTSLAKKQGLPVDLTAARRERRVTISTSSGNLPGVLNGLGVMGGPVYILTALGFDQEPANRFTDATFHKIAFRQDPDGKWDFRTYRPPSEYSYVTATAMAITALRAYHTPGRAAEVKSRIALAGQWLAAQPAFGVEEQAMRLIGLAASGFPIDQAVRELLASQRRDGAWSQLPNMAPDAYATGLALYALHTAASIQPSEPPFQKGVAWLLRTQFPDGSWHVQTHAHPLQPYFESGFPYGHHQWIAAAGTSWASLALLFADASPAAAVTAN
jgi:ankyrin repeat protein